MTGHASLSQRLYKYFGVLLALLLCLVGFSITNFRRLSQANERNVHTYKVLLETGALADNLLTMDASVRAFIVGGNEDDLAPFRASNVAFDQHFDALRRLTNDDSLQQKRLEELERMRQDWLQNRIEPALEVRRRTANRDQAILGAARSSAARQKALREMTALLHVFETTESGLLAKRTANQERWQWWTFATLVVGGLFSIGLTGVLVTIVANNTRNLDKINEQLRLAKANLETERAELARAETKLAETIEDLQRSNAELEQFAYVASHDLQEPLRAVAGCVQVLQKRYEGQLDARADQFIHHAVDGAQRMQTLINDLLTFSRVGTKGKPFESTDCNAVLQNALSNLGVALAESEAVLTRDELPEIMADAGQLEQVFQNLIGNAIKFRGPEPPQIHIGCRREPATEDATGEFAANWVFSVADKGPGIEPQYFERIFVMFQRLHTRSEYEGTGIGLALCKKIIERHDGKIWVESAPGEGSTFSFSLPERPLEKSEISP